jgi:hypothetical protein
MWKWDFGAQNQNKQTLKYERLKHEILNVNINMDVL